MTLSTSWMTTHYRRHVFTTRGREPTMKLGIPVLIMPHLLVERVCYLVKTGSTLVNIDKTLVKINVLADHGSSEIGIPIFVPILTKSAREFAPILRISWLPWTFTVASLAPMASAICLLGRPETTNGRTSRSRGVNDS